MRKRRIKIPLIIIAFLVQHTVLSAQVERYYTENWEGTDILKRRGKAVDDQPHGEWEYFTKEGVLYAKGEWQHGVKEGAWKFYRDFNGLKLKEYITYKGNKKNGNYAAYSLDGRIEIQGNYENDSLTGVWKKFYTKGEHLGKLKTEVELDPYSKSAVLKEYFYNNIEQNNDVFPEYEDPYYAKINIVFGFSAIDYSFDSDHWADANGEWRGYYESGNLFCKGEYYDAEKEGSWKYYFDNGTLWLECNYEYGENIGDYESYFSNGNLKESGTYNENGDEIGEWTNFHENGKLNYKLEYKLTPSGNTAGFGEYKEYFDDGSIKGEIEYGELNSEGTEFIRLKAISYSKDGEVIYYSAPGEDGFGKNSDGSYLAKWTYKDNVMTSVTYYENGNEKKISKFSKNENDEYVVKTGIWKYYNEDGTLQKQEVYENGVLKE